MKKRWIFVSIITTLAVLLINPLERYLEYKDSIRKHDIDGLRDSIELYIKYNSGGRINLGLVGTVYDSSSQLTDADGEGWIPITFRSSGVKIKKLPLDPSNTSRYLYTYTTSSQLKYKLAAHFESTKFKKLASRDGGSSTDLYEVGTDLSLKPLSETPE